MIGLYDASANRLVLVAQDEAALEEADLVGVTVVQLPEDYDPVAVNYVHNEARELVRNPAPLVAAIKEEAQRRILLIAPIWQQINDTYTPDDSRSAARRQQINQVRAWSDEQEALVLAGNLDQAWPNGG